MGSLRSKERIAAAAMVTGTGTSIAQTQKLEDSTVPGIELGKQVTSNLRILAQRHCATYRVDPAVEIHGSEHVTMGFDIELIAAHPRGARVLPGCNACRAAWGDLACIAEAVRVKLDGRMSITSIVPYQPSLTTTRQPDGSERDEVRLRMSIRHRHDYFDEVDRCEQMCREDIVETFKRLGIRSSLSA